MKRRALVLLALAGCGMPWPIAIGQPRENVARIGFLSVSEPELSLEPFRAGLRQHGYVEGRNIAIEVRFATRQPARLDAFAAELVASGVDVIVAGGSDSIRAAQLATKTIPIVMAQTSDAVGSGFVTNLARPGGNITGLSSQAGVVAAKRLQLIKQLVPGATRVGVLINLRNPSHPPALRILDNAGQTLGLQIRKVELRDGKELEQAFSNLSKEAVHALLLLPDNVSFNQRDRIVRLLAQARLPAVYWRKEWVDAGGLISYGQDNSAMYGEAATYVQKILKGAKPGDLAVEQPVKFEVSLNQGTAKALGIVVPQSIRLQADHVIE